MKSKQDLVQKVIGFQDRISQLIMEYPTEKWLSLDLTVNQLKSIMYIYSKGKVNFKELAAALRVTPPVVTGVVDRLVLHGLVKRKLAGSSADRRLQWLIVTDKGKALLDSIREKSIDNTRQILMEMKAEDLSVLVQGFSALITAAETYSEGLRGAMETGAGHR